MMMLFVFSLSLSGKYIQILCGFFSDSYVFSTVIVVILLSADFWTVRNVSGRVLVGLRFWNQVDEDGTSYWVFESRDVEFFFLSSFVSSFRKVFQEEKKKKLKFFVNSNIYISRQKPSQPSNAVDSKFSFLFCLLLFHILQSRLVVYLRKKTEAMIPWYPSSSIFSFCVGRY